jgi:hypothetical protein
VKSHDVFGTGALVQPVDVLRDEGEPRIAPAPRRENLVRAVGLASRDQFSPPRVPLPHEARVARERLGGRELLDAEVRPESVFTTERRDAARGRDAGARDDRDARGFPEAIRGEREKRPQSQ